MEQNIAPENDFSIWNSFYWGKKSSSFLKILLDNLKKGSILGDRFDMVVVAQLVRAPDCGLTFCD